MGRSIKKRLWWFVEEVAMLDEKKKDKVCVKDSKAEKLWSDDDKKQKIETKCGVFGSQ